MTIKPIDKWLSKNDPTAKKWFVDLPLDLSEWVKMTAKRTGVPPTDIIRAALIGLKNKSPD